MDLKSVIKVIGVLLMFHSISMLTPLLVTFYTNDHDIYPYLIAFFSTFATGFALYLVLFRYTIELKIREGFLVVVLFWSVLSAFSALPFYLGSQHALTFTDSIFEAVSGFTTTGVTSINDLTKLSPSLLYYRQQLQFVGGMGIIVLAVAILPMLGIGGMQLYRAETPGPMKDDKLTPRVAETAKAIWMIYVSLVIVCMLCYWGAGMQPLDALEESYATISTGGFSIHNESFAFYHNHLIEVVGIIFMILGGTNFSLHYLAIMNGKFKCYWHDEEFRFYLILILLASIVATCLLWLFNIYQNPAVDFVESLFNIVSVMTTTGFISGNFYTWPLFLPIFIMCLGLLGACAGSTSGGLKLLRVVLMKNHVKAEVKKLIHPQQVIPLKLNDRVVPEQIMNGVWAFSSVYFLVLVIGILSLMATGIDFVSAFGAAASSLANIGAAIGQYATSNADTNAVAKWIMIVLMLAGRFEIFAILLLLTPSFWRE